MSLSGKTMFISGASRGIGLAIAKRAAADGAQIAFQIHGRAHAGTPLLLIRPLGGSMALWGEFRSRLAANATAC